MNYDVIVIGAGHNSLTTACMLAKRRKRVLCLESKSNVGGLAASEEFHNGYKTAGFLHETSQVSPTVVRELGLEQKGLSWVSDTQDNGVYVPGVNGEVGFWIYTDAEKTAKHLEERFGASEAQNYRRYTKFLNEIRPVVQKMVSEPLPDISDFSLASIWQLGKQATRLRLMGKKNMLELLRVTPMCLADFLSEFFENDQLKAALALPALVGTYMGPWSPGSTANLLMQCSGSGVRVQGGPWRFTNALEKAFLEYGGKIICNSRVAKILTEEGRAVGVELESGDQIKAEKIISGCDPKSTFLNLMAPHDISHRFARHIENIRTRGTTAKVNLALKKQLKFKNISENDAEYVSICHGIDELEKSFDPVKYRELPKSPALQVYVPTITSPELAPAGHSVVSILVNFVPYDLAQGWGPEAKEQLKNTVVDTLETYTEPFKDAVVGSEVLSPKDLEGVFSLSGGQIHHGEHSLDQFICRPTPDTVHYATPIENLYLCSSGCFPGGGITGNPGYLASKVIS